MRAAMIKASSEPAVGAIYHEVRLFRDQGNQRGRSLRRFSELAKALDSKLASSLLPPRIAFPVCLHPQLFLT